jgi:hypothetical protein
MWADNETDEDLLGFAIHANLVKSIATDPSLLPVTIGLFGDWGGGKSSILKILERELRDAGTDDPQHLVVYFDTWVFEGYEDAKSAILAVLLKSLKEHRTIGPKIKDEVTGLLRRVNWMKAAKTGLSAAASFLTSNPLPLIASLGTAAGKASQSGADETGGDSKWLRDVAESAEDVKTFRRDFEDLIKKTGLKSLIILVDDLDRCTPERVIENLEAIKLFLNVKGVAFIIAADRRIVENAIKVRYIQALGQSGMTGEERERLVTDYLEKLVQVPYTLPKLAPHEVRSYLSLLLFKKLLPEKFGALQTAYAEFLSSNRYATFDLRPHVSLPRGDPRQAQVEEHFHLIENSSDPITDALKGNPRQIKRFLNGLWMRMELAKVAKLDKLDRSVLIKLMVLEYLGGDRFHELYESHKKTSDGTSELISRLEAAVGKSEIIEELKIWQSGPLARWVITKPELTGVDLRDYFWLSRSTLDHPFAGVQMVSQAVKQAVEQLLSGDMGGRQAGIALHAKLDSTERRQVASALIREALRDPSQPEPWQALFELANKDGAEAAEGLLRAITQADPDRINVRIAAGLGTIQSTASPAGQSLIKARDVAIERKGKFGMAVSRAGKK